MLMDTFGLFSVSVISPFIMHQAPYRYGIHFIFLTHPGKLILYQIPQCIFETFISVSVYIIVSDKCICIIIAIHFKYISAYLNQRFKYVFCYDTITSYDTNLNFPGCV